VAAALCVLLGGVGVGAEIAAQPAPAQESGGSPAAGAPGDRAAPVPTLEALLGRIGGRPRQQARFSERKFVAVLDAPVESAGVLRYEAPGRLEKTTERPRPETMLLDGDALVLQRDGRRRSLQADQLPGVAALVGALRDTLAGDAQSLRRLFRVVVQGSEASWQIDLLPLDAASAELVSRITLRGSADSLREIETLQADGDRSVMLLSPL